MNELSAKILIGRRQAGYTQYELAAAIGIDHATILRAERHPHRVSAKTMQKILCFLYPAEKNNPHPTEGM